MLHAPPPPADTLFLSPPPISPASARDAGPGHACGPGRRQGCMRDRCGGPANVVQPASTTCRPYPERINKLYDSFWVWSGPGTEQIRRPNRPDPQRCKGQSGPARATGCDGPSRAVARASRPRHTGLPSGIIRGTPRGHIAEGRIRSPNCWIGSWGWRHR